MGPLIASIVDRLKYFFGKTDKDINLMNRHCIFMEKTNSKY